MTPVGAAPSWPRLLAAIAAARLSGRLLALAQRSRRRRRLALALLVLADRCGGFGQRMLMVRWRAGDKSSDHG